MNADMADINNLTKVTSTVGPVWGSWKLKLFICGTDRICLDYRSRFAQTLNFMSDKPGLAVYDLILSGL